MMEVSHPESTSYGQHWTASKVAEVFAPSSSSVDAVRSWLHSHGVSPKRVSVSDSLGWLHMDLTVQEAEVLLKTNYQLYKHESGVTQVACDRYHIPEELSDHIGMFWCRDTSTACWASLKDNSRLYHTHRAF